jgi:type II secretory pathway pseudopilin PulG
MRIRTRRPAFSLASLLVVIAIIALLIGLMLPAVQKVREAANRVRSQNNLKQIALANLNYFDTNNFLPAGTDKDNVSGLMQLLPYLEQDNVYKTFMASGRKAVEGVRIKTFESPLDPLAERAGDLAPTSYQLNAGTKYALKDNDGVFYLNSKVKLVADIQDGTSNTVLAGETLRGDTGGPADVRRQHVRLKATDLKKLDDRSGVDDFQAGKNVVGDRAASWADGRFLQATYTATRLPNAAEPDVDCGGVGGLSALRSLNSNLNIGMCDGSVRSVSVAGVNAELWKGVHTRSGGETVSFD